MFIPLQIWVFDDNKIFNRLFRKFDKVPFPFSIFMFRKLKQGEPEKYKLNRI